MLKGLLLRVLLKLFGDYIESDGLTDKLSVKLWEGELKLTNLRIRRDALDRLEVPFVARSGSIGELTIKVPPLSCPCHSK